MNTEYYNNGDVKSNELGRGLVWHSSMWVEWFAWYPVKVFYYKSDDKFPGLMLLEERWAWRETVLMRTNGLNYPHTQYKEVGCIFGTKEGDGVFSHDTGSRGG